MAYVPNSGSVVAFQGTVPWSVLGSVVAFQGGMTVTSISGTLTISAFTGAASVIAVPQGSIAAAIVSGSISATFNPPANQSVSGTVGSSVIGAVPVNVQSSVATVIIGGSIAASFTPPANQSVSGTVGASIIGLVPVSLSSGSILAVPTGNQSVSGMVTVGSLLSTQGYVSPGNTISSQMSSGSVFTGAWEEVKDFSAIYVTVNADTASAADGLALQRSTNASSVIVSDTYTIPAQTGKTLQIQPDARYFRVQYTNSAANQGAMALQTVYKQNYSKPSSQRPGDGYTNETDLEQMQGFNMVYNGTTWDRMRGTTAGALITGSVQQGTTPWNIAGSVAAFQAGTQITSISGNLVVASASIAGQVTVVSSLAGGIFPVSGSVAAVVTNTVNVNTAGSVVVFQGTSPFVVNFQNSSILAVPVGSVQVVLLSPSIVGTYAEDAAHTSADKGLFTLGVRNDTVSSFSSANTEYTPVGLDSAGRTMTKPFAPGEASIIAITSIVSSGKAASVQLFGSPGTGLKNYITDFNIANSGANTTVVLFADSDSSILGRTIAPAGGGSNHQFATPLVNTRTATVVNLEILTSSSIVYATVTGFKAP